MTAEQLEELEQLLGKPVAWMYERKGFMPAVSKRKPEHTDIVSITPLYDITRRAPATLEEGLRDCAMFGKFVVAHELSKGDLFDFTAAFVSSHFTKNCYTDELKRDWPEFVAFVKEEMGL